MNKVAERLRQQIGNVPLSAMYHPTEKDWFYPLLDAALTDERLATVMRLEPWLEHGDSCDVWEEKPCSCGLSAEKHR